MGFEFLRHKSSMQHLAGKREWSGCVGGGEEIEFGKEQIGWRNQFLAAHMELRRSWCRKLEASQLLCQ